AAREQTSELEADFVRSGRSPATDEVDDRSPAPCACEGTSPRFREGSRSRPAPGSHADTPPVDRCPGYPEGCALHHQRRAARYRRWLGDCPLTRVVALSPSRR